MPNEVIAVDLGGTHLRCAAVGPDGTLSGRRVVPSPAGAGPTSVLDAMVALIEETRRAAGVVATAPIGVAIPGPLDPATGVVGYTPNLAGWQDVPFGPWLHRATGAPVRLGNDGNCAAVGEHRHGVARGVEDVVYLALGTGVGGGIISRGVLLEGAHGLGGEVGHVVIALDGPRCTCGGIGCLEAFASGWALAREGEMVAATADGAALKSAAAGQPMTPAVIARAAEAGDPTASRILQRAGHALGAAIGAFANLFNPELVVIGGGVGTLGELLLGPARDAIPSHAFAGNRRDLRLARSVLGDDTALLGAAALAREQLR